TAVGGQRPGRVARRQPRTGQETAPLKLTRRTGVDGVDGIGRDPLTGDLLVPDSPNGTLLEVVPGTGAVTELASGLGRPVDAAVAPGGGIVVTAENPAGLLSIPRAGGAGAPLGSVTDADDLLSGGGLLYVTMLGTGQVRAVDPSTGASTVLVTGIAAPQGLTLLTSGRLAVADSTTGVVATLAAC